MAMTDGYYINQLVHANREKLVNRPKSSILPSPVAMWHVLFRGVDGESGAVWPAMKENA
jgi:hypothetical protein